MKKRFSNNKGFSLVELIIVVAIMAVLIGILAPQYLKYVEKSRFTADNDYVDSVRKACETIAGDPSITLSDSTYTVTINGAGTTASGTDLSGPLGDLVDMTNGKLKSKTYSGKSVTVAIDFTATDSSGNISPEVTVGGDYVSSVN